ncbi:MAG: hypothetical protein V4489_09405 [Chlamydiota bacterium]
MNYKLFLTVYAATTICMVPGNTQNTPFTMTQSLPPQALPDALYQIGGETYDIGQLSISGVPSKALVKAFTKYADDSDNSKFNSLSQIERDALVFFGFKLQSKGEVSDSAINSLMMAEKMRTGMPKAHIKELLSLIERIKANPNYELTHEDVMLVDSTAPFINIDPYAFSDVLGSLLGPVLHATPENIGISSSTEDILVNAAKTITGLTQEQMDNLQNISNNYQDSQQFTSSSDNVNDINQVAETSYYPDSANLLLPFLGADALITMSEIHYAYPNTFYGEGYNQYNRTVVRNPTVEAYNRGGYYPRYNNNWANNRSQARNDASQARENGSNNRSQDRANGSDNRSQARENGSDNRSQDRGDRSANRGGGDRGGSRGGGGGGGRR